MGNGTDDPNGCTVCGSSTAPDAMTCGTCGARLGASVPSGSRAPEDATNLLRVPSAAGSGAASSAPSLSAPSLSAPGSTASSSVSPTSTSMGASAMASTSAPTTSASTSSASTISASTVSAPAASTVSAPAASAGDTASSAIAAAGRPGLTQSGLPARIPRQDHDDDSLRQAFAQSWEALSEPSPVLRQPFTPTYLTEPPRPRRPLSELIDDAHGDARGEPAPASAPAARVEAPGRSVLTGPAVGGVNGSPALTDPSPEPVEPPEPSRPTDPPEPIEPPRPLEPPKPIEPPEPPKPPEPMPPVPDPGPTPFPAPTPPVPPGPPSPGPLPPSPSPIPVPPSPNPPMPGPIPVPPPGPPIPAPPAPFPAPPGPLPTPLVISAAPASPSLYQGGNYGELETQSITGFVTGPALAGARSGMYSPAGLSAIGESPLEMSGSLTGHILARGLAEGRKRERRHRWRSVLWVTVGLLGFMVAIAVIVELLAGDFISSLVRTFAGIAG
jgi:hypothetical protein